MADVIGKFVQLNLHNEFGFFFVTRFIPKLIQVFLAERSEACYLTVGRKKTSTRFVFLDTFGNYPADFGAVFLVRSEIVPDSCKNY